MNFTVKTSRPIGTAFSQPLRPKVRPRVRPKVLLRVEPRVRPKVEPKSERIFWKLLVQC